MRKAYYAGGMSSADDLIAFFAARLDEKEAAAKAAASVAGPDWKSETFYPEDGSQARACLYSRSGAFLADLYDTPDYPGLSAHIALNDPARVLREVAAGRRLIEWFKLYGDAEFPNFEGGYMSAMEDAVRDRAAVYSDHPDYREEWKP